MNTNWPQQPLFIERVKEFARVAGHLTPRGAVSIPAMAAIFNVSESTLRQCLHYRGKQRLAFDTLAHIAKVVGCSVNDFTGTAGQSPPGVPQRVWGELPEGDRLFASTVLEDVMADKLSATEKSELFGAYQEAKARMLRLRK